MQQSNQDACSVIFEKNQFSWTKKTPKKLQFENYQEMTSYYKIYEADQLARAFDNVDKSQNDNSSIQTTASIMTHYADRSLHNQPKWAHRMQVAYQTKYFVFYKA